MIYPPLPEASAVASHFCNALGNAERAEDPYLHWKLSNILPEQMCTGILTLPIAPPVIGKTDGTRDTYNDTRAFFTLELRSQFPACAVLADALQRSEVARQSSRPTRALSSARLPRPLVPSAVPTSLSAVNRRAV